MFLVALALFAITAFGQTDPTTPTVPEKLAKAEKYIKTVDELIEKRGKPDIVIADASDYTDSDEPKWKTYPTTEAADEEDLYTIAYVWKSKGRVVAINLTYSSPSGDWAQYVSYTFYRNGQVAKVDRELRTFMDDMILNRIKYFDESGKIVKETTEFFDLASKEPIPAKKDFMDIDVDIYESLDKFPFASLLGKKKQSKASK